MTPSVVNSSLAEGLTSITLKLEEHLFLKLEHNETGNVKPSLAKNYTSYLIVRNLSWPLFYCLFHAALSDDEKTDETYALIGYSIVALSSLGGATVAALYFNELKVGFLYPATMLR